MRQGSRNKKFALATPTRECRKSRKKQIVVREHVKTQKEEVSQ